MRLRELVGTAGDPLVSAVIHPVSATAREAERITISDVVEWPRGAQECGSCFLRADLCSVHNVSTLTFMEREAWNHYTQTKPRRFPRRRLRLRKDMLPN